ncbi:MAG: hypothetical protein J0I57_07125, partial [Hyphomicrobium sp.]|nr:hypothetical protein [Hyphomicrobium sp.]
MAKLPSEANLTRREYKASSPSVSIRAPDYAPLARGVASIGEGISVLSKAQDEVDDYETRRRLLDFRLETEMALEESKRDMAPGGEGYTASWQEQYRKRAQAFVGRQDANIPDSQRGKVGLL